jgi:YbbR domain-containing protein
MKTRADWLVLLICLITAVMLWWQINSQHTRRYEMDVRLRFVLADSLRISDESPDHIQVTFFCKPGDYSKIRDKLTDPYIQLDLLPVPEQKIATEILRIKATQLLKEWEVQSVSVYPESDSLTFKLHSTHFKKVKVVLDSEIAFYPGYEWINPPLLTPDSITLFGPKGMIDTITSWPTEKITLSGIRDTVHQMIKLKATGNAQFSLSHEFIDVQILVEQFTEKEMKLPIHIMSQDKAKQTQFRSIPSQAIVYAKIPVDSFQILTENDIQIGIYSDSARIDKVPLTIQVIAKPDYVRSVKLYPKFAEIIQYQ